MRKRKRPRPWRVEWRAEAKSDGLDRLGQMVKLVIDHAVLRGDREPRSAAPGRTSTVLVDERRDEERTT